MTACPDMAHVLNAIVLLDNDAASSSNIADVSVWPLLTLSSLVQVKAPHTRVPRWKVTIRPTWPMKGLMCHRSPFSIVPTSDVCSSMACIGQRCSA